MIVITGQLAWPVSEEELAWHELYPGTFPLWILLKRSGKEYKDDKIYQDFINDHQDYINQVKENYGRT